MSTNPWDADFTPAAIDTDLVKTVEAAVAAGEAAVASGTQAVDSAITAVVPTPSSGGSVTVTTNTGGGGGGAATISLPTITSTLESVISTAAKGSAEKALLSLAPEIEAELAQEWEASVTKVINRVTGGTDVPPVPNLEDFIHADARSRAFRTLLMGLFVAVLTGLGTAGGQLAGADWSTHNGQVAALTIAVGSVVTSLGAYFSRLISEPEVTKPLTAQLPAKSGGGG